MLREAFAEQRLRIVIVGPASEYDVNIFLTQDRSTGRPAASAVALRRVGHRLHVGTSVRLSVVRKVEWLFGGAREEAGGAPGGALSA
jgi:hypothetical protein